MFLKEKELIFVGRSNSGKSSLINSIFNEKKVAHVAKRTGTTANLHFHHIKNANALVVDAPGYGFAKMNLRRRAMWFSTTEEYIKISSRLSQIFLCINFEHGLKQTDIDFLHRIHKNNVDIQVIFTKVDKVHEKRFFPQLVAIDDAIRRLELKNINRRLIACSTKTGFGINVLQCRVVEAIEQSKQRNIDQKEDLLLDYLKELRVSPVKEPHFRHKSLSK